TVPEAIVARQMGLDVLGLSCITNMAAGVLPEPLHQNDVLQVAGQVAEPFGVLLTGIIRRL
ncbi:MAG: purine-nucleoside phosphorylase, partial [Acidobacteriota bacterium]|nr:purine-nucleoside phosphorylase [Acidobacteriota bacterium]